MATVVRWQWACNVLSRSEMVSSSRPRFPSDVLTGVHVLVADDDEDARVLVATVLEYAGALVSQSASGREALDVLDRVRPHVVVSDIAMPGGDGYWLVRELRMRAHAGGGAIPAVAITAYGSSFCLEARDAGANEALAKPLGYESVQEIVSSLLAPM